MTQKEITISGKIYILAFNFATVIQIEETTGKPFDLSTLETKRTSELLSLIWSAIKSNNPACPTFDDFARQLSVDEFKQCNEAIAPLIGEFFGVHLPGENKPSDEEEHQDPYPPVTSIAY